MFASGDCPKKEQVCVAFELQAEKEGAIRVPRDILIMMCPSRVFLGKISCSLEHRKEERFRSSAVWRGSTSTVIRTRVKVNIIRRLSDC